MIENTKDPSLLEPLQELLEGLNSKGEIDYKDNAFKNLLEDNFKPYVPCCFEGIMELFGKNLKRKQFQEKLKADLAEIALMAKKNTENEKLISKCHEAMQNMTAIFEIGMEPSRSIINEHNRIFSQLIDRIDLYQKNKEKKANTVVGLTEDFYPKEIHDCADELR